MKSNEDEAKGASEDTSPGQDNDNPNNCNGDDNVNGIDSGNVDDDLDMVDRCAQGDHPGDCIVVDWLKGECCIKCNSGSGKVLVCCENGCPIAIHEACLTWQPDFDDKGKFYCPYCLFKQEGDRVKELRMKSISAGKELSDFICLRRDGGNEEKQEGKNPMSEEKSDEQTAHGFDHVENGGRVEEVEDERANLEGASVSETEKKASSGDCENGLNNDDKETIHHSRDEIQGVESMNKEKSDEVSITIADGFENVGNGERMEEDIEKSSDTEDDSPDLVSKTLVAGKKHDEQTGHDFDNVENGERIEEVEEHERVNLEGASVSETTKKMSSGDCGKGLNNDDKEASHHNPDETQGVESIYKEKSDEGSISGADGFENVGNGERIEEDIEYSSDTEDDSPGLVSKTLVAGKKHDEQTADKAQSPQVVSTDKSSFQPSTSAKNTNMNREGKTVTVQISAGHRKSSEQPTIPIMGGTEKRRRLNWTAEEEDMLKTSVSATEKKASAGDCQNEMNSDDKETSHHNLDETQGVEPINKEKSDEGSNLEADGSMNKEKSDEGSISGADGFENVGNVERMKGKKHDEQTADKAQSPLVVSTDKSSFQPSTSAKNTNMNRKGKTVTVKISAGRRKSSEQPTIPIMGGTKKRRRLNWTAEEEDMLKTNISSTSKKTSAGDCQNGLNNDDKETSHRNPDETQGVEPINKEKSDKGSNPGVDGSMNKEKSDGRSISGADGFENVGNGERMEGKKHDEQTADKAQPPKVVSKDKSTFQPSTSANNTNMNREGKTVTVKISAGCRKSSEQPMIPIMGGTEKRRRLHWTVEEEDMLKDLVKEFSMKVNKNIPWRKILEHGRSVFHSTRTPADLKDKWKNIVAKEISKG